jgi:hypothetical protein
MLFRSAFAKKATVPSTVEKTPTATVQEEQ